MATQDTFNFDINQATAYLINAAGYLNTCQFNIRYHAEMTETDLARAEDWIAKAQAQIAAFRASLTVPAEGAL